MGERRTIPARAEGGAIMAATSSGRKNFPGAVIWFSYGKPTKIDKVGCDGVYVRRVLITNALLYFLYSTYLRWEFWNDA